MKKKQLKRWTPTQPGGSGFWSQGATRDIAAEFGNFIMSYSQLEYELYKILAIILNTDGNLEQFLLHGIPSERKVKILKHILTQSPYGKDATQEIDEIIDEFDNIRMKRNEYVHGIWLTETTKENKELVSYSKPFPEISKLLDERINVNLNDVRELYIRTQSLIGRIFILAENNDVK